MHSILGRESFCRNDCFNAAWHGGNQPVALLRCYGGPGCFDSGLKLIQSVGSCVSQLSLHNIPQILYGVQVRRVGRPIEHSNTMVSKPFTSGFGTVSRCQVVLKNEIFISIKLFSRWKHEVLQNLLIASCTHSAKTTGKWFTDHGITVLNWPANSPDLNPIENLWDIVKKKLRDARPNTLDELKAAIEASWASITPQQCHRLIASMPHRIEAVISAKGFPTKY
uniref:Tc1-like transposase DDE domain-containing protein n=1 Tax=Cyprinus carpio carpio TaxID=630221 RepID=A0A9J8DLD2_CYPCA